MRPRFKYIAAVAAACFSLVPMQAQTAEEQLNAARQMHCNYDFDGALDIYESLLQNADSALAATLQPLMLQSENGLNMLNFATNPTVVAAKEVPAADFYLWYGHLSDKGWIPSPNEFTPAESTPGRATYLAPGVRRIVFSAPGADGKWSLVTSEKISDTLWSAPSPVSGAASSQGNDIFPLVSQDGQRLYFSSNGLAGMGGYDIYVCTLSADGRTWSAPENLGFPYSSPYDDFLYDDTPDGRYSIFSSNRGCSPGNVRIYVLAFENQPVRKSVTDEEARTIASLKPKAAPVAASGRETAAATAGNDGMFAEYFKARKSLEDINNALAGTLPDEQMMNLQGEAARLGAVIGEMEMQWLAEGIVPPAGSISESNGKGAEASAQAEYQFTKNTYGTLGQIRFEIPEDDQYAFKIESAAAAAFKGNDLPKGICYQIQLCAVSTPLKATRLKGISPVFEVRQKSGKYIYYAGRFATWAEVTAALPKVRNIGFPSAFITAWSDGKSCQTSTARAKETNNKTK